MGQGLPTLRIGAFLSEIGHLSVNLSYQGVCVCVYVCVCVCACVSVCLCVCVFALKAPWPGLRRPGLLF